VALPRSTSIRTTQQIEQQQYDSSLRAASHDITDRVLAPTIRLPLAVLLVGSAFAGMLFLMMSSQIKARGAAETAAAELRRSQAALQQSENSQRRLVESNLIGVVIGDAPRRHRSSQ